MTLLHCWRSAIAALILVAVTSDAMAQEWRAHILWSSDEKIQAVAAGDADPRHAGIEALCVTNVGTVRIAGLEDGRPWSDSLYRHGSNMTGLVVADIDPTIDGNEVYVGGSVRGEKRGEVVQIAFISGTWRSRTIWRGPGFVHAFGVLKTGPSSSALIVPTNAGTLHSVRRDRAGKWIDAEIFRFVAARDSADMQIKDLVIGRFGSRSRGALFCTKGGALVLVDLDTPGQYELVHREAGGIARIASTMDGGALGSCNGGNLVRVRFNDAVWHVDTLFRETDQGRGVAFGKFRDGTIVYPVALFGYPGYCRLLRDNGIGWDMHNVFRDVGKAHWMISVEMVPGNDSDELVLGGYSGRLLLVTR